MARRWLLGLAALLSLAACSIFPYTFRTGTLIDPADPAPAIPLSDQDGRPFDVAAQKDGVTLVFFGFTTCPDICPTTLADLAAARQRLGADGQRLRVVLITVDPERDTPEKLGKYVRAFDPSFTALTGPVPQLEAVYKAYGVTAVRRDLPGSAVGYTIDHSGYIYAVDQRGRWRAVIGAGSPLDDMVSDLRFLLRGGS